jgi:molybdenum cofactor synthesis domain-containing protein
MENKPRQASIIIIGDEILSGMVKDTNSHYIVDRLRTIGIETKKILVIGDDIDEIGTAVKEFSGAYDIVFTSGGIGPTHDDVTIEAIAKGFGVEVIKNQELINRLRMIIGKEPTDVQQRMALIPKGAEVIADIEVGLPLIVFKNIYILPGIPKCLQRKMEVIERLLGSGSPPYVKKVYVDEYESVIAPTLSHMAQDNRSVKIGSYPTMDNPEYRVMVSFSGYNWEALNQSVEQFVSSLPNHKVVRIETWIGNG